MVERDLIISFSCTHTHTHTHSNGPIFGSGADLFISEYCNSNQDSYSQLGHSYGDPTLPADTLTGKLTSIIAAPVDLVVLPVPGDGRITPGPGAGTIQPSSTRTVVV